MIQPPRRPPRIRHQQSGIRNRKAIAFPEGIYIGRKTLMPQVPRTKTRGRNATTSPSSAANPPRIGFCPATNDRNTPASPALIFNRITAASIPAPGIIPHAMTFRAIILSRKIRHQRSDSRNNLSHYDFSGHHPHLKNPPPAIRHPEQKSHSIPGGNMYGISSVEKRKCRRYRGRRQGAEMTQPPRRPPRICRELGFVPRIPRST